MLAMLPLTDQNGFWFSEGRSLFNASFFIYIKVTITCKWPVTVTWDQHILLRSLWPKQCDLSLWYLGSQLKSLCMGMSCYTVAVMVCYPCSCPNRPSQDHCWWWRIGCPVWCAQVNLHQVNNVLSQQPTLWTHYQSGSKWCWQFIPWYGIVITTIVMIEGKIYGYEIFECQCTGNTRYHLLVQCTHCKILSGPFEMRGNLWVFEAQYFPSSPLMMSVGYCIYL